MFTEGCADENIFSKAKVQLTLIKLPKIRPVLSQDFEAWKTLWDDYIVSCESLGIIAPPPESTIVNWSRFLSASEPVHAMVAESNGELVGFVHYLFHLSTFHVEPTCYLQDIFTTEAARGGGLGRALIESVYERAMAAGAKRVYWQTHEANSAAVRLYDSVAKRMRSIAYRKML